MIRVTVHTDGPVQQWDFMIQGYSSINDSLSSVLRFQDNSGTVRTFNRDHVVCVTTFEMKEPDASKG
jgi:hypothetical protein